MPTGQLAEAFQFVPGEDLTRRIERIAQTEQSGLFGDELLQAVEMDRGIAGWDRKRNSPGVRGLYGITEQKIDRVEKDGFIAGREKCLAGYIKAECSAVDGKYP